MGKHVGILLMMMVVFVWLGDAALCNVEFEAECKRLGIEVCEKECPDRLPQGAVWLSSTCLTTNPATPDKCECTYDYNSKKCPNLQPLL